MTRSLPVSKARQGFLKILRDLERHPDWTFNILRFGRVVARISAALPVVEGTSPWRALIEIGNGEEKRRQGKRRRTHAISEHVDEELLKIYESERRRSGRRVR